MDDRLLKKGLSRYSAKDHIAQTNDEIFGWATESLKNPIRIVIHKKQSEVKSTLRPKKAHINICREENRLRTTSLSEFFEEKKSSTTEKNFLFGRRRPLTSTKRPKNPQKSRPFTNILLNKFLNIEKVYTNKGYTPKKLIGYRSRRPSTSLNTSKYQSGTDLYSKNFMVQGSICKLK